MPISIIIILLFAIYSVLAAKLKDVAKEQKTAQAKAAHPQRGPAPAERVVAAPTAFAPKAAKPERVSPISSSHATASWDIGDNFGEGRSFADGEGAAFDFEGGLTLSNSDDSVEARENDGQAQDLLKGIIWSEILKRRHR